MKRTFLIFIFMLFFSGVALAQNVYSEYEPTKNEVVFNQSIFKVDVIDPIALTNSKGANYPGL